MKKKTLTPLILALLASLLFSSVALAQAEPRTPERVRGARRGVGRILSIGPDSITLEGRQGFERTFLVDENTRFRSTSGEALSQSDLQSGDWVAGITAPNSQGQQLARLVILLPADYDPSQRLGAHAAGKVTGVDVGAGSFSLHTLRGEDVTFVTNENTIFEGGVETLADFQEGMQAAVSAYRQEDGSLLALAVVARLPVVRNAGEVTAVDVSGGTFTLKTLRGETLIIMVDENTRFRSKDGGVQSLADLAAGMRLLVRSQTQEGGSHLARLVQVGVK